MKLDATDVRYITPDEFRVLTAVEMGSKNHEVVPTHLIAQISSLRHTGISKLLSGLLKRRLVARVRNNVYDGFRLTYGGYDYLAVRALSKRKSVYGIGNQIGIGKESDIYIVSTEEGECRVLKIHRLGRISFRNIKEKRDYMGKRKSASWMYMSRLAAEKEYAFMQILHQHGFPVPTPVDQNRHTLLMSYEDAYPLRQISVLPLDQIRRLYSALMALIVRLARAGLIHGDFNEFNLLVREIRNEEEDDSVSTEGDTPSTEVRSEGVVEHGKGFSRIVKADSASEEESEEEDEEEDDTSPLNQVVELGEGVQVEPILIDFPQMVSTDHPNADMLFDRDVNCVRRFFRKRFRFESEEFPSFAEVMETVRRDESERLDVLSRASGFNKSLDQDDLLASHYERIHIKDDAKAEENEDEDDQDEEDEAEEGNDEEGDEGERVNEKSELEKDGVDVERVEKARHDTSAARPAKHSHDVSYVASRTAASRAHAQRQSLKHHGRKAQSTKTGRRHGGGKAKYNSARTIQDSFAF